MIVLVITEECQMAQIYENKKCKQTADIWSAFQAFKNIKLTLGVDFINCFAPYPKLFEKLFTGSKVWRKAQKIGVKRKKVYAIDPWSTYWTPPPLK